MVSTPATRRTSLWIWMVACALLMCLASCGATDVTTSSGDVAEATSGERDASDASLTEAADDTTAEASVTLAGWQADAPSLAALMDFVSSSVDEDGPGYIPPEDRIAVFDMDGTLMGERFPTYFNDWLYIQHALHDDTFEAPQELKEFAQRWEDHVLRGAPLDDFDTMERELGPRLYEGLTIEEYLDVVRAFKQLPVWGFEGMTYGETLFDPMVSVVQYLCDNDYTVWVCSGTYRDAVRTMMEGTLDAWVPKSQVIGTDLLLAASGQDVEDGSYYTMQPEEDLVIAGRLFVKNLKTNKVLAMQREIGSHPVLAFGNSTGDFAMANYALNNPNYQGAAFMLLADDTERDYGNEKAAGEFAAKCEKAGFTTVSMRDDWTTIYGEDVHKVEPETELADAA